MNQVNWFDSSTDGLDVEEIKGNCRFEDLPVS